EQRREDERRRCPVEEEVVPLDRGTHGARHDGAPLPPPHHDRLSCCGIGHGMFSPPGMIDKRRGGGTEGQCQLTLLSMAGEDVGRQERPLNPAEGTLEAFASDLRSVRRAAGSPSYRALARRAGYS